MARYGDRYENCGDAVDEWYKEIDGMEGSSTFDICDKCIGDREHELLTKGIGGIKPYGRNEPVGDFLVGGIDRPPYTEKNKDGYIYPAYWEWYKCASCNVILVDRQDAEQWADEHRTVKTENGSYVRNVRINLRKGSWGN